MPVVEGLESIVRNLTKASVIEVFERLNNLCLSVHHEGAIGNYCFVDGLATEEQNIQCTIACILNLVSCENNSISINHDS